MKRSRDIGLAMPPEEADVLAAKVLQLMRGLVRGHHAAKRLEPTGITVAPEMRPYVERKKR